MGLDRNFSAAMAPWVDGGPCANPACKATRAAVWYGGDDAANYCHLRPCRRMGGYLPLKRRGSDRTLAGEDDSEDVIHEKCYDIKAIVGIATDDPRSKKNKKQCRNVPAAGADIWLEVVGTFVDPEDDGDEGGPDRRWVQMEDLGHVSKAEVKKAIAAWHEEAKRAANAALAQHVAAS